jgi:arsenate reductase
MAKIYTLKTCDTCRKAVRFLRSREIPFEEIPIRETPPSISELRQVLETRGGDVRALFNTSGREYQAMGMKDLLPTLTEEAALELLAGNGSLVKRPLFLGERVAINGFREAEWTQRLAE